MALDVPTEDVQISRDVATSMVKPYVMARDAESAAKKDKERLGQLLRKYIEDNYGEPVYDGEIGYELKLQERSIPGRPCDLNAVYDGAKPLFEQLLRNGCLRIDEAAVKRAGALVGGIEMFMGPQGRTTALVVEKK